MRQTSKPFFVSVFLLSGLIFVLTGSVCSATVKASYKDCLSCHEGLKQDTLASGAHAPFRKFECGSCHDPHTSNYKRLIKEETGVLCRTCHTKMTATEKVSQHLPVQEGNCTACHDPHASTNKRLLTVKEEDTCFVCHKPEDVFPGDRKHSPAKQKKCLKCHDPHGSDNASLLVKGKKEVCITCHLKGLKSPETKKAHMSYPVSGTECVSCHNPHASNRKNLIRENQHKPFRKCTQCHNSPGSADPLGMKKDGAKVCLQCHKKTDEDFKKINSHVVNGIFCANCHNPHASDQSSMKKGKLTVICLACHTDTKERMDDPKMKFRHPQAKKGNCTACHDPHGSNFRLFFPENEITVCTTCHTRHAKFSHPVGDETVDPRSRRDITCITCHDLMGSQYEFELRFDRKQELCIQCHTGY